MQPMRKSYHEWWGLPLFFLQKLQVMFGTKNNLPKGLAEKIEFKKKKKKNLSLCVENVEDQSPLG